MNGLHFNFRGEEKRLKYYIGKFFTAIQNKDYEVAYNLLSSGYKKNYFTSYEDFEEYAKETYGISTVLTYEDIQREGELYIVKINVSISQGKTNKLTQTFIVKENNFNDYELAFSK